MNDSQQQQQKRTIRSHNRAAAVDFQFLKNKIEEKETKRTKQKKKEKKRDRFEFLWFVRYCLAAEDVSVPTVIVLFCVFVLGEFGQFCALSRFASENKSFFSFSLIQLGVSPLPS